MKTSNFSKKSHSSASSLSANPEFRNLLQSDTGESEGNASPLRKTEELADRLCELPKSSQNGDVSQEPDETDCTSCQPCFPGGGVMGKTSKGFGKPIDTTELPYWTKGDSDSVSKGTGQEHSITVPLSKVRFEDPSPDLNIKTRTTETDNVEQYQEAIHWAKRQGSFVRSLPLGKLTPEIERLILEEIKKTTVGYGYRASDLIELIKGRMNFEIYHQLTPPSIEDLIKQEVEYLNSACNKDPEGRLDHLFSSTYNWNEDEGAIVEADPYIHTDHYQEWTLGSGIDPELTKLNLNSSDSSDLARQLLQPLKEGSDLASDDRNNRFKFSHYSHGFWFVKSDSGHYLQLKPNNPQSQKKLNIPYTPHDPDNPDNPHPRPQSKTKKKKKASKYRGPEGVNVGVFMLQVPDRLAKRIARKHVAEAEAQLVTGANFWEWVQRKKIEIWITEGAKKAAALLTSGRVAIGIAGIWNSTKKVADKYGHVTIFLNDQLRPIIGWGSNIVLCYDCDRKKNSRANTRHATHRLGKAIQDYDRDSWHLKTVKGIKGRKIRTTNWKTTLGKGIDDVWVRDDGREQLDAIEANAKMFRSIDPTYFRRLNTKPDEQYTDRWMRPIPESCNNKKIIAMKGAKGTGKSRQMALYAGQWLARMKEAVRQGLTSGCQRILLLPHRRSLGRGLCHSFEEAIKWERLNDKLDSLARNQLMEELRKEFSASFVYDVSNQKELKGLDAIAICPDSLRAQSQSQFELSEWENCLLIIDESEQVMEHLFFSETLRGKRSEVIPNLAAVIKISAQVFLADADLSDTGLKFYQGLAEAGDNETYLIVNDYKFEGESAFNNYVMRNEGSVVNLALKSLTKKERILFLTSGQKETTTFGSTVQSEYLKALIDKAHNANLKVLIIDSETLGTPGHPAITAMSKMDDPSWWMQWDLVVATPSIETGLDFKARGVFTKVLGIFNGAQTDKGVCQMIGRYREPVDRFIYVSKMGFGLVANGETSLKGFLVSHETQKVQNMNEMRRAAYILIEDRIPEGVDSVDSFDFPYTNLLEETAGKVAVRINAGKYDYDTNVFNGLASEGHRIIRDHSFDFGDDADTKRKKNCREFRDDVILPRAVAEIESAPDIDKPKYNELKKQLTRTKAEQRQIEKYLTLKNFGVVNEKAILAFLGGQHSRLKKGFLLLRNQYQGIETKLIALELFKDNEIAFFDINRNMKQAQYLALEIVGFVDQLKEAIANPDKIWTNDNESLKKLKEKVKEEKNKLDSVGLRWLNSNINRVREKSPIEYFNQLMRFVGLPLHLIGRQGTGERLYQYQLAKETVDLFKQYCQHQAKAYEEKNVELLELEDLILKRVEKKTEKETEKVSCQEPISISQTASEYIIHPRIRKLKDHLEQLPFGQLKEDLKELLNHEKLVKHWEGLYAISSHRLRRIIDEVTESIQIPTYVSEAIKRSIPETPVQTPDFSCPLLE
ncbi:MAG: DUF3854 domain-containing protein [Moorea sp. SIO2I5]|nr:DUF3854 domain-containing protein [Moorena sp. SIO2I5]